MILRRLTEHVRTQNWFAVALDFIIVVVGVFIGIQLGNWNEARLESQAQARLVEQLIEEFSAVEPAVAELAEFSRVSYQSTASVIETLRAGVQPAEDDAFRFALARANWVQSIPQMSPTYTELLNSGTLSSVADDLLRQQLIAYGDAHDRLERLYPSATTVVFDPQSVYLAAVDWNMDPASWAGPDSILAYDWQRLVEAKGEMQAWIAVQYDLARYADEELAAVRAIRVRLDELRR